MSEAVAYTAAEAAFVIREPIRLVKKALDDGPVQAELIAKPGGTVRAIEWSDLLYFYAVRVLRDELTPKGRNEFYHALKGVHVDRAREVRFGRFCVVIDDLKAEGKERSRKLVELAEKAPGAAPRLSLERDEGRPLPRRRQRRGLPCRLTPRLTRRFLG